MVLSREVADSTCLAWYKEKYYRDAFSNEDAVEKNMDIDHNYWQSPALAEKMLYHAREC
jgi:hypothetical protein